MKKPSKSKLIKNLKALCGEIRCDEIESSECLTTVLDDIVNYLYDKEGYFEDEDVREKYENIEEFIDIIKSCIDEISCEENEFQKDLIDNLQFALEIIQQDA